MQKLHFEYNMELGYTNSVDKCHFTIKCIPKNDARQRLLGMDIMVHPEVEYAYGEDSFYNKKIYGCVKEPHTKFIFHISGDVEVNQTTYEELAVPERIGMYRYPYGKCKPGPELLKYLETFDFLGERSDYDKSVALMHKLHQDFVYVENSTQVCTEAEEAWVLGKGVCQDYAHICITLLRLMGIPARYVCGLMIGEGASHAWVEALCGDRWIGFDPTNDCMVFNDYIKLGDGRDAGDCSINRGIMWGGGNQSQKVYVSVEEYVRT